MNKKNRISVAVLCGIVAALTACNNLFHELAPVGQDRILSFTVPGQVENAIIGSNDISITVGADVEIFSLLPVITVSPRASLVPITLEYVQATFPGEDVAGETIGMNVAEDFPTYVRSLIKRTPHFTVPKLDIPIDFSNTVVFFVVSDTGKIRQYRVNIALENTNTPGIVSFGFSKYCNPALIADAVGTIDKNNKRISIDVVFSMEITEAVFSLIPSFEILGESLIYDSLPISSNNNNLFFNFIERNVTKEIQISKGGLTEDYSLVINFNNTWNNIQDIYDFRFDAGDNYPKIAATSVASIVSNGSGGVISAQVFYTGEAPPTALCPRIMSSGVVSVGGITQNENMLYQVCYCGVQNFSQPVEYVVLRGEEEKTYTVYVEFIKVNTQAPQISSFKFSQIQNPDLLEEAYARIAGGYIMVDIRCSGNSSQETLIPEFTASGLVTVNGSIQVSGFSAHDFSRSFKYTVFNPGAPELKRDYWVYVRIIRDSSNRAIINSFGFFPEDNPNNPDLLEELTAKIDHTTKKMVLYVPDYVNFFDYEMIPRFSASGPVNMGGMLQISSHTSLQFSETETYHYTVASANGQNRQEYELQIRRMNGVIYVKQDATGKNDGTSWQDAFRSLKDACDAATQYPDSFEKYLWIAKGTYRPGVNTDECFAVTNNTRYIGGFAGWEEDPGQRRTEENHVIINGNIQPGKTKRFNAAFYNCEQKRLGDDYCYQGLSDGTVVFEDLFFEDFMVVNGDFSQYFYSPISVQWQEGSRGKLEVSACQFRNIKYHCIQQTNGSLFIGNGVHAERVASLYKGFCDSTDRTNFNFGGLYIVDQVQYGWSEGFFPLIDLDCTDRPNGSMIYFESVHIEECWNGFNGIRINAGYSDVLFNSLDIKDNYFSGNANESRLKGFIEINNAANLTVSNSYNIMDTWNEGAEGFYYISGTKGDILFEYDTIRNINSNSGGCGIVISNTSPGASGGNITFRGVEFDSLNSSNKPVLFIDRKGANILLQNVTVNSCSNGSDLNSNIVQLVNFNSLIAKNCSIEEGGAAGNKTVFEGGTTQINKLKSGVSMGFTAPEFEISNSTINSKLLIKSENVQIEDTNIAFLEVQDYVSLHIERCKIDNLVLTSNVDDETYMSEVKMHDDQGEGDMDIVQPADKTLSINLKGYFEAYDSTFEYNKPFDEVINIPAFRFGINKYTMVYFLNCKFYLRHKEYNGIHGYLIEPNNNRLYLLDSNYYFSSNFGIAKCIGGGIFANLKIFRRRNESGYLFSIANSSKDYYLDRESYLYDDYLGWDGIIDQYLITHSWSYDDLITSSGGAIMQ